MESLTTQSRASLRRATQQRTVDNNAHYPFNGDDAQGNQTSTACLPDELEMCLIGFVWSDNDTRQLHVSVPCDHTTATPIVMCINIYEIYYNSSLVFVLSFLVHAHTKAQRPSPAVNRLGTWRTLKTANIYLGLSFLS